MAGGGVGLRRNSAPNPTYELLQNFIRKFLLQPFQYRNLVCASGATYLNQQLSGAGSVSRQIFAPSLHTEHIARKLENSSVPPIDLSTTCAMCKRVLRDASYGWASPATAPHI